MPRQPAALEIGARPFAAVVEEADIVVGLFQRLDLARDEAVEFIEIGDQIGRQCEIQGVSPGATCFMLASIKERQDGPSQGKRQVKRQASLRGSAPPYCGGLAAAKRVRLDQVFRNTEKNPGSCPWNRNRSRNWN
jgi:hypothetical protein